MSWSFIIPIIVFGLVMVMLEIFVLPGFVAGVVGGLVVVYGVYQSYAVYGATAGSITLFATIAVFVLTLVLFFKSGMWKKVALSDVVDGKMNTLENIPSPGDRGKAISRLAPMGKALINNEYYEVSTNGEFIDADQEIEVIRTEGGKVLVKRIDMISPTP